MMVKAAKALQQTEKVEVIRVKTSTGSHQLLGSD